MPVYRKAGDVLCLVSDGVIYAGVGNLLNFGWTWDNVASYLTKASLKEKSAQRLAVTLSQVVNELYMEKPGDDSTVLVARVAPRCVVNMLAGPPKSKEDDSRMVRVHEPHPAKK